MEPPGEQHLKKTTSLSLWALIESLQNRFEVQGLDHHAVDAAVIGRVGSMLARQSKNDQRQQRAIDFRALLTGPVVAKA